MKIFKVVILTILLFALPATSMNKFLFNNIRYKVYKKNIYKYSKKNKWIIGKYSKKICPKCPIKDLEILKNDIEVTSDPMDSVINDDLINSNDLSDLSHIVLSDLGEISREVLTYASGSMLMLCLGYSCYLQIYKNTKISDNFKKILYGSNCGVALDKALLYPVEQLGFHNESIKEIYLHPNGYYLQIYFESKDQPKVIDLSTIKKLNPCAGVFGIYYNNRIIEFLHRQILDSEISFDHSGYPKLTIRNNETPELPTSAPTRIRNNETHEFTRLIDTTRDKSIMVTVKTEKYEGNDVHIRHVVTIWVNARI